MVELVGKTSEGATSSVGMPSGANTEPDTVEPVDPPTIVVADDAKTKSLRSEDLFAQGDLIGRYLVLGKLGQGGMGLVYSAYDPDLSRRVAIKVLRDKAIAHGTDGATKQALLLREAQAMAQLSHPNVLPIYDVGTVHGRVFIATEYVEGQTLKEWIQAEPRSWREILRVFMAAGRGLAAAHRAGLIHRDFKPQNVMIGQDSAIRVMDFGLARLSTGAEDQERESSRAPTGHEDTTARAVLGDSFTVAGTVMGTPAYMAPEQHAGQALGPAADQYAFCVALFEALYGVRPFVSSGGLSLARVKERMRFQAVPETSTPRWLKRILIRGLAPDPDERWPSMETLLETLGQDPWLRARRIGAGVVVLAAIGSGLATAQMKAQAPEPCGGAKELVRKVWNPQMREQLRASFVATDLPYADNSATKMSSWVDAYARDWTELRTTTCRATQVHREQSEIVMDRKMACLDGSLEQVSVYLQTLAKSSSEQAINQASVEFPRLSSLELCKDADALARQDDVPIAPEEQPTIDALRESTLRLNAFTAAAALDRIDEEIARVEKLQARASHAPTRVKALWSLHKAYYLQDRKDDRDRLLPKILKLATEYDDKSALSLAWTARLWTVAVEERRMEAAKELVPVAEAAARLAREEPNADELIGVMNNTIGAVELSLGNLAEAEKRYRWTCDRCDPVATLNNLSIVLIYRGKTDEARKVLADAEQHLEGSSELDPAYADLFLNRGLSHHWEGDLKQAKHWYERALNLSLRSIGKDRPKTLLYRLYLGHVLTELGEWEDARQQLTLAHDGFVAAYGEGIEFAMHARTLQIRIDLTDGGLRAARADMDQLLKRQREAGVDEITLGYVHPLEVDGTIALAEHDWQRAEASFGHALEFYRSRYEEGSTTVVTPLLGLAEVHRARQDAARAGEVLAEAIAIQKRTGSPTDLRLARALEIRAGLPPTDSSDTDASVDLRRALEIWERTAPEHPHTAVLRRQVASTGGR